MQNNDNHRFYPLRDPQIPSKVTLVPITEEQYRALYPEIWRIRNREQNHGRCMCPKHYEKKLLGITAMQKLLGKSRFDELLTA